MISKFICDFTMTYVMCRLTHDYSHELGDTSSSIILSLSILKLKTKSIAT